MYSRDIFPRYSSGGLPIPENYSGNAIRRTAPPAPVPPRHTPSPNTAPTPPHHTPSQNTSPRAAVPLTVSPSFGARQSPPPEMSQEATMPPLAAQPETAREPSPIELESEQPSEPIAEKEKEAEAVSVSAPSDARDSSLSSLLSHFLPPKPGGGILSQIGLEEALLLGLFLLLSQSEEEQDTLLLLALLFLYR